MIAFYGNKLNKNIMSILFHKKSKKVMGVVFGIVGVLVVTSMILLYAPGILSLI
jgi:hypothetical protein